MRAGLVIAAAILLSGCETHCDGWWYFDIPDHFPLDGSLLAWEYDSEATSDHLTVEKTDAVVLDGLEVVTLTHTLTDEDGEQRWVADVRWVSDSLEGVLLMGYTHGEVVVDLEPPVQLAEWRPVPGDVSETFSTGRHWTSTFERLDGCATPWVPGWEDEQCVVITLDDGDDLPETNGLVTGNYRLVPHYGAAWLELDAYGVQWRLSDYDWAE
jgi:hypothetical protein